MGHEHEGLRVSRRVALAGIGAVGLGAILAACSEGGGPVATSAGGTATISPRSTTTAGTGVFDGAGTCALTPETTPGPYYFDVDKIRSDIREDREGARLRLAVRVQESGTCRPLPDAVVEIWHCDAEGLYSGAEALSTGGGAPARHLPNGDLVPADPSRYLRGAQVTDAEGIVEFTTVWPGWYPGRAVHIHAMVHLDDTRACTTQVMFGEEFNDRVLAAAPYRARAGSRTRNDEDGIFADEMLLKITEDGDGYLGAITFAVEPA